MAIRPPNPLRVPLAASFALHLVAIVLFVVVRAGESKHSLPPPVNVTLVAGPVGERAVGVVNPPKVAQQNPTPPRAREAPPKTTTRTQPQRRPTTRATASTPPAKAPPKQAEAAPKAGGGPVGGKGTDVANVKLEGGIDFPYPPYIQNIMNQVLERFKWNGQPFTADVSFLIMRDGSVAPGSIRIVSGTRNYAFRIEASGAIESAGDAKAFGPLPSGFSDDVLAIVFTFDPKYFRQ